MIFWFTSQVENIDFIRNFFSFSSNLVLLLDRQSQLGHQKNSIVDQEIVTKGFSATERTKTQLMHWLLSPLLLVRLMRVSGKHYAPYPHCSQSKSQLLTFEWRQSQVLLKVRCYILDIVIHIPFTSW